MIEEVVSIELPVHERMVIKKNRLTPKDYNGEPVPRISIVTGIHGDELDGQQKKSSVPISWLSSC